MRVHELIQILPQKEVVGDATREIAKIEYDSRLIKPEDMFVALVGAGLNGHAFVPEALERGAVCIVVEKQYAGGAPCQVIVPDSRHALALLSAKFYAYPSRKLKVIGVTGTNGKTTTTYMVKAILEDRGKKTGLLGTIEYLAGSYQFKAFNTTPESLHIERLLSIMLSQGCRAVVMEVSSHALAMSRVRMIDFNVVGFTNLTQDHLDFHKTMEEYREAKALLFDKVKGKDKWAVLNLDDPNFEFFLSRADCSYLAYSLSNARADVRFAKYEPEGDGFRFQLVTPLGEEEVHLKLAGKYNLSNALCAAALAMASGIDSGSVKRGLESLTFVPGRMEKVDCGQPFKVFVDYAHTPDALRRVLTTARALAQDKRLVALFGCGGDRDKSKRPLMAQAVSELADLIVLTSDNPRTEDPLAIIREAQAGLDSRKESKVIVDRREAIGAALKLCRPGDVLVIAGKGHEDYQILGDKKIHFDDREVVREFLEGTV